MRNGAFSVTSWQRSHHSSVVSSRLAKLPMPAWLIRMSTTPNALPAAPAMRSISAPLLMSAWTEIA